MQNPPPNDLGVLIVDDDEGTRDALRGYLERVGCKVIVADGFSDAARVVARGHIGVAFVDSTWENDRGLDIISQLAVTMPDVMIVLLAGDRTGSTEAAERRGVWDFLHKPFTATEVHHVLDRVIAARALRARARDLRERLDLESPPVLLASRAPAMQKAVDAIERAARSDAPVLLRGEKGTGKKLLAWTLHRASLRAERSFFVVSCASAADQIQLNESLAADGGLPGAVGGTLFLDEVHLLPQEVQATLVRLLRKGPSEGPVPNRVDRMIKPDGVGADVRIIATTSDDLDFLAREQRIRQDLVHLLDVVEVHVPPLRERPGDILSLARHFLEFFSRACGRRPPRISGATEAMLVQHGWPGNVRELRNVIERAVLFSDAEVLEPNAFPDRIRPARSPLAYLGGQFTLDAIERDHILGVIAKASTLDEAANVLGIDTSTLWRKRKRYMEGHVTP